MEIRADYQKGLSCSELGRKCNIDRRTAKKYGESDSRPVYNLTDSKPSKLDPYKVQIMCWLNEAPYSAMCMWEKLREEGFEGGYALCAREERAAHLATALGMETARHRFSTYYINCHNLIEQLKKAHFENRLPDKLKALARYKLLIIDEIGYLPMDIQGAILFFQLIARRYEKASTIFTSNKTFSQWNNIFADVTIASAILDRVLHHCSVIHIKGESYRLKERKEYMRQKVQATNTLFEKASS